MKLRPSLPRAAGIRRSALACAFCFLLIGPTLTSAGPKAAAAQRPSLVLIVTDDQRWDTTFAMPVLQRRLADRGVTFNNAFVVNPLCCPSRASILTGQYSHSTGVYDNEGPFGGFKAFDDSSTLATWLDDSGYTTGLIGKYINGYNRQTSTYVPPGWDRWIAFTRSRYYDYTLTIDGRSREFGSSPEDYSTDVLADRAASFIRTTSGPLFLYWAPKAPHASSTPAPRHLRAFRGLPPSRPPNYNELDMVDKPAWLQGWPAWTEDKARRTDRQRKQMLRTLLAVDDGIDRIMDALRATGRLQNTMIAFVSDNGFTWGEHRLQGKLTPYEESIRVPYIIRYDPLTDPGIIERRLVANIDLAPTFAAVAGVPAPEADGRNLNRLFSSARRWRDDFLIEHHGELIPTYCQIRSDDYSYVRYTTGEEELYDMRTDRYQLDNAVGSPGYGRVLEQMRERVRQLCDPPPPGFSF